MNARCTARKCRSRTCGLFADARLSLRRIRADAVYARHPAVNTLQEAFFLALKLLSVDGRRHGGRRARGGGGCIVSGGASEQKCRRAEQKRVQIAEAAHGDRRSRTFCHLEATDVDFDRLCAPLIRCKLVRLKTRLQSTNMQQKSFHAGDQIKQMRTPRCKFCTLFAYARARI